jgi:type I restriction enzyme R subunit
MKGRGSRVIADSDFAVVTPDGRSKTHAVLVDAVGVSELLKTDEPPLERKRSVSFGKLLEAVAVGADDDDTLSTLAGRLGRLAGRLSPTEAERVAELTGGRSVRDLARGLVQALDADERLTMAIILGGDPFESPDGPSEQAFAEARRELAREALAPFDNPDLRDALTRAQRRDEQTIDLGSADTVLDQGFTDARAKQVVSSFRAYLEQHQDEIAALQLYYSRPRAARLDFREVKRLAEAIQAPPLGLTEDALWQAYARLDHDRVRDASGQRVLTDLVALVRYALERDRDASATLEPFAEGVRRRFAAWLAEQERRRGQPFTDEQRRWLAMIRGHVATSLAIDNDAFDEVPFNQYGGLGKASQLFGAELPGMLTELNERLVA